MGNYKYNGCGGIVRLSDGATIPQDDRNADYQAFLASGETPEPADAEVVIRTWTPYEFYSKFTSTEKAALLSSTDSSVQEFRTDMQLYQVIYPDSAEMDSAMNHLVSIGILTETRKQEILA